VKAGKSGCVILHLRRTPHLATEQALTRQWDFLLHRSAISSSPHIALPKGKRTHSRVFSTPESPKPPHRHYCQLCCQQQNKHYAHLGAALGESNCSPAICGHSPASLSCEFLLHGGEFPAQAQSFTPPRDLGEKEAQFPSSCSGSIQEAVVYLNVICMVHLGSTGSEITQVLHQKHRTEIPAKHPTLSSPPAAAVSIVIICISHSDQLLSMTIWWIIT